MLKSAIKRFWHYLSGNSSEEVIEINENNKRPLPDVSDDSDESSTHSTKRQRRNDYIIDFVNDKVENNNSEASGSRSSYSFNSLSNGENDYTVERTYPKQSFMMDTTTRQHTAGYNWDKPKSRKRIKRFFKENVPSARTRVVSTMTDDKNLTKSSALLHLTKMREKMVYNTLIKSHTPNISNILNEFSRNKFVNPVLVVDLTNDKKSILSKSRTNLNKTIDVIKIDDDDDISIIVDKTTKNTIKSPTTGHTEWIHNLTKRFDQREVQRRLKIEDEKIRAQVLHEQNKVFDKVLLDRLIQQLHVKEVIDLVDEEESDTEPETILPKFTPEQEARITKAMRSRSQELLTQKFGYSITGACVYSLSGLNWLNDNVINFYMKLLSQRGDEPGKPKVHAMDSFFCVSLKTRGYSAVRRWTRKVDIFSYDLMPIPVHVNGVHWCMLIIDFRNKTLNYYDSMGGSNNPTLDMIEQYLKDESLDKKKVKLDFSGWKKSCVKDIPQQMNGCDCGVFSCMFAEYICRNARITFSQDQMPYFRRKMCLEILEGKLLT